MYTTHTKLNFLNINIDLQNIVCFFFVFFAKKRYFEIFFCSSKVGEMGFL